LSFSAAFKPKMRVHRGWIRRLLFERLHLADLHFYPFRLAFGPRPKGADIVLPKSGTKPALAEKSALVRLWCSDAAIGQARKRKSAVDDDDIENLFRTLGGPGRAEAGLSQPP
jgi:hypothetical protein